MCKKYDKSLLGHTEKKQFIDVLIVQAFSGNLKLKLQEQIKMRKSCQCITEKAH